MNKKNAKMLSGTLAATTVLTSAMSAAPVFAKGTDWNKVYENAYKAMQKAEQDKTQESINVARKAIAELAKNKNLMPLVGTLSEHVDGVQQGLFNDFYALMYVDGKEKPRMSQKEINAAREYVDSFATCAGNKQYTESWSSAVDKFQQNNVNETVAAVKKAQETKDAKDIEAAKTLIAELEASKNKDVLNAVAGEKAKVEAVEKEIQKENAKLKVEKVQFANLKKATISFNKELDEASVKKAGNVRVFKGNDEVNDLTVKLAEDKKSVYVVNDAAHKFDQLQTYRFVISNVATVAGEKLAKTELTAKASDNSFPTVVDVKATSPKTLVVKFSEPVKGLPEAAGVTEKIQIDGINAYLSGAVNVEKMLDENTAVISLGNALTVGEHTVKISDLKDEIGLPLEDNLTKVTLVEDKVVPAVTKVVANKNTVTVTFNKVVDKSTVIEANVKVNGQEPQNIKTKDGQTYELTLAEANKLGLASLIEAKLTYNNIADNYGNKVEKEQTVVFTSEDDKVAPTMKVTKVNDDNSVEIAFTEKVENAKDKENYKLLDKDGKEVADGIQGIVDSEKKEEKGLVFKVTLKDAAKLSGKFSLKAKKDNTIIDESVRGNKLAETTVAFELKDKVAPEVKGNVIYVEEAKGKDFNQDNDVKDSKFTVHFTKAMNPETLLNKANYIFNNKSLLDLKDATLTVGKDNKSVTVTINRNGDAEQEKMQNAKLRVLRLEDSIGNRIKNENVEINFIPFVENVQFTTMIEKAELVSSNQVKLYAKEGQTITKVDLNKISFIANDVAIENLQVMKVDVVEDGASVILTLSQNVDGDAKNNKHEIKLKAEAKAITNNEEISNEVFNNGMKVADMVKASLLKKAEEAVKVEGNKVTLTFDEALTVPVGDIMSAAVAQSLVVKDAEGNRLSYVDGDYSVEIKANQVIITIKKIGFNDKVSVALENNTSIFDTNKVSINDFKVVTKEAVKSAATGVVVNQLNKTQEGSEGRKASATISKVDEQIDTNTIKIKNGKKEATFTKAADDNDNNFTTVDKLVEKINGNADINVKAALDSSKKVLTIEAKDAGEAGNNIELSQTGDKVTINSAKLVDGKDGSKTIFTLQIANGAKIDGTLLVKVDENDALEVNVNKDNTANEVATKIAAALNGKVNGFKVEAENANVKFTSNELADKTLKVVVTDKQ